MGGSKQKRDVHIQGKYFYWDTAVSMSVVRVRASSMRTKAALERGRFGPSFLTFGYRSEHLITPSVS